MKPVFNMPHTKLSPDDLAWLYRSMATAFRSIKGIKHKTPEQIEGEVFTSLRRMSQDDSGASKAIKGLFTGRLKTLSLRAVNYASAKEQMAMMAMYNSLKASRMAEESDGIRELELALLAMRGCLAGAKQIVDEAKKVREGMEQIPRILNGEEGE